MPVLHAFQPNLSAPSLIEKIHAWKALANLPLRQRSRHLYDQHTPPDLSTTEAVGDYIQGRTAAWKEHLHRLRKRRASRKPASKNPHRTAKKGRK